MTLQDRISELSKNPWVKGIVNDPVEQAKIPNGDTIYQVAFLEISEDLTTITTRNQSIYVSANGDAYYHVAKPIPTLPKAAV